jgi:hypothetical protein
MLLATASFGIHSRLLSVRRRAAMMAAAMALALPAFLFAVVLYVPALARSRELPVSSVFCLLRIPAARSTVSCFPFAIQEMNLTMSSVFPTSCI